MILEEKEIKKRLRYHLKRKLKILGGHGHITIRRLGMAIFKKNGTGFKYAEQPSNGQLMMIYSLAEELCIKHGGKRIGRGYDRNKSRGSTVSRVYQF